MDASAIINAVRGVTAKWAKQRKREEREASAGARRREGLIRSRRVTLKKAAYEAMDAAYAKASGITGLAMARQVMYAARGQIQERTGRQLDDKYFLKTLLPEYMIDNPETCASWDVAWDDRGHFAEPHTGTIVGLGTLAVREYLKIVATGADDDLAATAIATGFPTKGPRNRFRAVLFIEKEGFLSLLEAVHLAERYDLALMTSKGLSTTAGRTLVDYLCGEHGIPLLVLHDLDKNGFSILGTLKRNTWRYTFKNKLEVIDLGLRLADVTKHQLESELVVYGNSNPALNLRLNGATEEEIAFLCAEHTGIGYSGQRVELNAFTSDALIAWIESKLKKHGIKKVVPDVATLEHAYRRAAAIATVNQALPELVEKAQRDAGKLKVPARIANAVQAKLRDNPAMPWDLAIAELANEHDSAS
jgi:hypothetical protein